jgi:hypothetical protein
MIEPTYWRTVPGVPGRVGSVHRGVARAGEALRVHLQWRLRRRPPILLSNPSVWMSRTPAAAFRRERFRFRAVWAWLPLTLPAGSVTAGYSQPSESDVVHDHIGHGQHQIVAITCIGLRIRARHVQYAGTTPRSETVDWSSCGIEFSSGRGSTKMINNGCSDANRKVLVKGLGEHLLPTAQVWGLWRPAFQVAARFA